MDEEMEKKIKKEESIVGFSALFTVLAMSFGGVPSMYIGVSLIIILLLQFLWDIYEVNRREHQVYKRTLKTLIFVSLIVGIASAVFSFFP
ncbi:hypothetical protein CEH05_19755 [Halobacillus halophilus]|uniref:Uncharacterized protein n=1 Tax=Halobacillus halophilus (strain ATCC 35676 / DSM 2266 / JCM 20832 / KCTC 3685 / LMG 17431 / NBRC 102448 / NCIMB 2269) TaxID=866895 RepID=I0JT90_HALH3|nr:hypothetical protein [Halobacillus halophilus]ASF41279.1 hypothetical protein CEH05_19755 [Halobacillus halophilus]CCG47362.1 hypothetical protein HBHAL_5027 [Halobacillus halophilus DSM 2266]